jgi:hypothetical protein
MRRSLEAFSPVLFLALRTGSIHAMDLHPENFTIDGVVVNGENLQPLAGANVVVEGDTIGCLTDGNGRFLMTLKSGARTIRISFIGFNPLENQALPERSDREPGHGDGLLSSDIHGERPSITAGGKILKTDWKSSNIHYIFPVRKKGRLQLQTNTVFPNEPQGFWEPSKCGS